MSDLLDVRNLHVTFRAKAWRQPPIRAVDDVSFTVAPGETVGLVGESGSGKSTIGRAILGLTPVSSGSIRFRNREIARASRRLRRELARELQAVFQDPYSSLNPRKRISDILVEPLLVQRGLGRAAALTRVADLLSQVRLPADAGRRLPRDFSGGQRQRIAIARALATHPALVICDEAVSALDLSTQAQVINLLGRLQSELGLAYLFVSHDLSTVQHMCERIIVLYRGRIMEYGPADAVGTSPKHPYARALLASAPVSDPVEQRRRRIERRAAQVVNETPVEAVPAEQCPFAARCPIVNIVCWTTRPTPVTVDETRLECHAYDPASGHPESARLTGAVA